MSQKRAKKSGKQMNNRKSSARKENETNKNNNERVGETVLN